MSLQPWMGGRQTSRTRKSPHKKENSAQRVQSSATRANSARDVSSSFRATQISRQGPAHPTLWNTSVFWIDLLTHVQQIRIDAAFTQKRRKGKKGTGRDRRGKGERKVRERGGERERGVREERGERRERGRRERVQRQGEGKRRERKKGENGTTRHDTTRTLTLAIRDADPHQLHRTNQ